MDLQTDAIEFYTKVTKCAVKYDQKRFARVVTITLEANLSQETKTLQDSVDGRHFIVRFTEVAVAASARSTANGLGHQMTLDDAEEAAAAAGESDDAFARAFPGGVG